MPTIHKLTKLDLEIEPIELTERDINNGTMAIMLVNSKEKPDFVQPVIGNLNLKFRITGFG